MKRDIPNPGNEANVSMDSQNADRVFIRKLTEIVLANLENENFGVKDLAKASGKSLYTIGKRLHSINGNSVNQFVRETRLNKALELLRENEVSISEIAYKVGFSSPAYFNYCFRKRFGCSPGKAIKDLERNIDPNIITEAELSRKKNTIRNNQLIKFSGALIFIILSVIFGNLVYRNYLDPELANGLISSDGRISVVVMPFQNLTHDTVWNIWRDGVQQTIISYLSNSKELRVIQKRNLDNWIQEQGRDEITTYTSFLGGKLRKDFGANLFLQGSIKKSDTGIRLEAQLINPIKGEVMHAFEINGSYNEITLVTMTDSLRRQITDYLLVSKLIKENPWFMTGKPITTSSPDAVRYCIYGDKAFRKADWSTAKTWYFRSLAADTGYVDAMAGIYYSFRNLGMTEQSLHWVIRLYKMREKMNIYDKLFYSWTYSENFEPPDSCIRYLKQLQEIDDQSSYLYLIGAVYVRWQQYEKAIEAYTAFLKFSKKKGKDFLKENWVYPALGEVYHSIGEYRKEKRLYRQAERINTDQTSEFFSWVIRDRAALAVTEGDSVTEKKYVKRLKIVMKDNSASDADIVSTIGWIYWRGGNLDKAEACFREALRMEPDNPARMNTLANRLVERHKNFDEFVALMDKTLTISANSWEYYNYLDTKA